MLPHVTRPRCANWSETSESGPPCGYSRAPSRTVGYGDIFWSADHGPWRPYRRPTAILLPVPSPSLTVGYGDISCAADHGPCRPYRSPLAILLPVRSQSLRVAAVAAFHATCGRSA